MKEQPGETGENCNARKEGKKEKGHVEEENGNK